MDVTKEELSNKSCVPCRAAVEPLKIEQIEPLLAGLPDWELIEQHHIERVYSFKDFKNALNFTDAIGQLAEEQGHHPEITLTWGKATVSLYTHKIHGLHPNDFILAAKFDHIYAHWVSG